METQSHPAGRENLSPAIEIRFPPEGEEISFRPTGWGRYFAGAFLVFWLCGWAVGEVIALGILLGPIIRPFVREESPRIAGSLPEGPIPFPVWVFLGAWTIFWTFGGLGALHTLLRLLIGRDRFVIGARGVSWCQKPFGRTRTLLPHSPIQLELRRRDKALVLIDGKGTTVLSQGGEVADRLWLLSRLRTALGLPESSEGKSGTDQSWPPAMEPPVPSGWEVDRLDGGAGVALRKPRSTESKSTGCAVVFAALWTSGIVWFFSKAGPIGDPVSAAGGFAAFLLLATSAIVLGTLWVAFVRDRWIARPGVIEWERLLAGRSWKRVAFRNPDIAVSTSEDSDNDEWFELKVSSGPVNRKVLRTMNNVSEPVNLARFLAYHSKASPRIDSEALDACRSTR